MATITARIDEKTKIQAEEIATSIGLNLSSVISVFINRFVAERGFPFAVTDPMYTPIFDRDDLTKAVTKAVMERKEVAELPESFFIIPKNDSGK